MTHPRGCCLNEKLKGTTYICFAEVQAKPNLAVTKGWILQSKITGDLKTLCTAGIISWYFRSVVREVGNIMRDFRRPLGISWVWEGCRWEKSPWYSCQPMDSDPPLKQEGCGWRRNAKQKLSLWTTCLMRCPAICWPTESLLWKPTLSTARGDPGCRKESEEEEVRAKHKSYWVQEGPVTNFPV